MKNQVIFTKDQFAQAKSDGNPLVALCFDDGHLARPDGGFGRITIVGPMAKEKAAKVKAFMLDLLKVK